MYFYLTRFDIFKVIMNMIVLKSLLSSKKLYGRQVRFIPLFSFPSHLVSLELATAEDNAGSMGPPTFFLIFIFFYFFFFLKQDYTHNVTHACL